jgi:hypothetical protein
MEPSELVELIEAAAARGGGEIVIPAGRHLIGPGSIRPRHCDNVHIRGEGRGATVLYIDQQATTHGGLLQLNGNQWSISDLTVDCGDFFPDMADKYAALCGIGNGWTMENVEIRRQGRVGILVTIASNFRILNCNISKTDADPTFNAAILFSAPNESTESGQVCDNILVNSSVLSVGSYHLFSGNKVTGWKYGAGIFVGGPNAAGMRIIGNDLSGGLGTDIERSRPAGIECWSKDSVIANNRCCNNSGAGISTGGANTVLTGNICRENGRNGIAARMLRDAVGNITKRADYNVFVGNQCVGNEYYGYAEQDPGGFVGIKHGVNVYTPNGRGDMYVPVP